MTTLTIGAQVGNYVVKKKLGSGGMGAVFLAEHPRISRQVAIKVLDPVVAVSTQAIERFEAEAQMISSLDHPNIVAVFDFGRLEDGSPYYVMEFLKGSDLQRVMAAHGTMLPGQALPYVEQICRALEAAHSRGIVHRDLKPENIFVLEGPELRVKVLDFGIAKLLDTEQSVTATETGVVMGTPLFMAPEQAAGQRDLIGPATDIYSLGVLLYWMLCGKPPFDAKVPMLVVADHIHTQPPPLGQRAPCVSPEIAELVHRCLEKDPAKRPSRASQVVAELAAAVDRAGSEATLPMPAQTQPGITGPSATTLGESAGEVVSVTPTRPGRTRAWLIVAVATLSAALGAGLYLAARTSPEVRQVPPARPAIKPPVQPVVRRTITVGMAGLSASCRLEGGGRKQEMTVPCRFEVPTGQLVRLTVLAKDLSPFVRSWQVDSDYQLRLVADRAGGRIAIEDPRVPPSPPATAGKAPPARHRTRRAAKPPAGAAASKRVSAPGPDSGVSPPPKPKRRKIGDSTLEVDL